MGAQAAEQKRADERRLKNDLEEINSDYQLKSKLIDIQRNTIESSYQVKQESAAAQQRSAKADNEIKMLKQKKEHNQKIIALKADNLTAERAHQSDRLKRAANHQMNLRVLNMDHEEIMDEINQRAAQEKLKAQSDQFKLEHEMQQEMNNFQKWSQDQLQRNEQIQMAEDRKFRAQLQNSNVNCPETQGRLARK